MFDFITSQWGDFDLFAHWGAKLVYLAVAGVYAFIVWIIRSQPDD